MPRLKEKYDAHEQHTPSHRQFLRGSSVVLLGAAVLLQGRGAAVGGSTAAPDGRFPARNVAGTYGFVGHRTILPNAMNLPEGLCATVNLLTFDGRER